MSNQEISTKKSTKWLTYFSTIANGTCMYALLGTVSMIKEPISQQFQFSEYALGITDGMIFLGIILGLLYGSLFTIKKIVKTTAIFSTLTCVFMNVQSLGALFPSYALLIICVCRVAIGFFFYSTVLAQSIANYYFRQQQDQKWMQIWYGTGALGELIAILLSQILMNELELDWKINIAITTSVFLLSCIYLYTANEQVQMQSEQNKQTMKQNCLQAVQYYRKKQNILQTLIYLLIDSQYYAMFMWLPYFFHQFGYEQASYMSLSYPTAFFIGCLISQPLQEHFKKHLGKFFLITFIISTVLYFSICSLGDDPSQAIIYVTLIFLSTLLVSGFNTYCATSDLNKRTSSHHQYLLINSTNRVILRSVEIFHLIITGILMETDPKSFIKYTTGIMVINCILIGLRLIFYPKSYYQSEQQTSCQQENHLQF